MEWVFGRPLRARKNGPRGLHEVSRSAQIRYLAPAEALPEGQEYRPNVLQKYADDIRTAWQNLENRDYTELYNGYDTPGAEAVTVQKNKIDGGHKLALHTVREGETLSEIARDYGDFGFEHLQGFNKVMIPDPNKIYRGQIINVPPKEA